MQLRGIGAAPGICIGKAYIVDREGVEVVHNIGFADADARCGPDTS